MDTDYPRLLDDPKRIKDLQELRSILSVLDDVIVTDDYCFCANCVKIIFDLDKQYRVVTDYGLESILDALRPPGMEHYQIHTGEDLLAFLEGYFVDFDDDEDYLEYVDFDDDDEY